MRSLAGWIRSGKLPEDIDIGEIYEFWIKHHNTKPKYKPWSDKPRFYNRAMTCNTRAKSKGDTNKITADDLELVFTIYKGQCNRCKSSKHLVFDHIVPYYRGGTNTVDNLQVLCRLCNMEKGVN